jgi:hypothetical protein
MHKLAYSIRNRQYIIDNNHNKRCAYIPQLYIKVQNWQPPPATNTIENELTNFEKTMERAIENHKDKNKNKNKRPYNNLTPSQKATLKELKTSKDFVILPTDKNLGPAIINRTDYIKHILHEHLLTTDYEYLTHTVANNKLQNSKNQLIQAYHKHKHQLSDAEIQYFSRSFKQRHRTPIFYGLPKIHKTPLKFRPVVSCIDSFSSIFSNWLDYKMKKLLHLIPSYIKDSRDLLNEITLLTLPPGAKLFTADATAMYTNITTYHGVQAIQGIFNTYSDSIPHTFPKSFFLTTLEIIMDNNIFSFGDTFWRQLHGTTMGTPAAPLYSILSFGFHENTMILPNFANNLFYYKRFIDDVFGIWVDTPDKPWESFKTHLNSFGNLRWNIEDPSLSTTFLDLEIRIHGNQLLTKTYQKPMNLYLYIPPLSAHPNSCFKGLITGEILRYWLQNSNTEDFIHMTSLFIQRLIQRGHTISNITPILRTAAALIDNDRTRPTTEKNRNNNTLFIHWKHNPNNIDRSIIRTIYNNTLRGIDNFQQMKIAVSRPPNLRDLLCHTQLPELNNNNVSNFIPTHLDSHSTHPNRDT